MLNRRELAKSLCAAGAASLAHMASAAELSPQERFWLEGRYLPRYLELLQEVGGSSQAQSMLSQFAALIGDEGTAIRAGTRRPSEGVRPSLESAVSSDAIEAITQAAAGTRLVVLNEAHHISGHRAFATRVMRALRPLGYEWFAAETFTPAVSQATPSIRRYHRGMPFHANLGYYTRDPVFAELVREAAEL